MNRSLFETIGDISQNFAADQRYCSNHVDVSFQLNLRSYGCKLTLLAVNKNTDKVIFHSIVKIRSHEELSTLEILLHGIDQAIEKYAKLQYKTYSD